jgi:hypothetical protein
MEYIDPDFCLSLCLYAELQFILLCSRQLVVFLVVVILTDESLGAVRHPPKSSIELPTGITTVEPSALPNSHSGSNDNSAREQQPQKVSAINANYSLWKVFLSFSLQAQHRKQMLFKFYVS